MGKKHFTRQKRINESHFSLTTSKGLLLENVISLKCSRHYDIPLPQSPLNFPRLKRFSSNGQMKTGADE